RPRGGAMKAATSNVHVHDLYPARPARPLPTPGLIRWLVADPRSAWLWLALRLYIGWEWMTSGKEKIWPAKGESWLTSGNALKSFWAAQVRPSQGRPQIGFRWYRHFIQYMLDHEWYT